MAGSNQSTAPRIELPARRAKSPFRSILFRLIIVLTCIVVTAVLVYVDRAGYRDNMIKVGDTITVYIAPLKDGSDGGYVTAALTANGTRFGMRSRAELEQERLKAEGKK